MDFPKLNTNLKNLKVNNLTAIGTFTFPSAMTFGDITAKKNLLTLGTSTLDDFKADGTTFFSGGMNTQLPVAVATTTVDKLINSGTTTTITRTGTVNTLAKNITSNAGAAGVGPLEFDILEAGLYEIGISWFFQHRVVPQNTKVNLFFYYRINGGGDIMLHEASKTGGFYDATTFVEFKRCSFGYANLAVGDKIIFRMRQVSSPPTALELEDPTVMYCQKIR